MSVYFVVQGAKIFYVWLSVYLSVCTIHNTKSTEPMLLNFFVFNSPRTRNVPSSTFQNLYSTHKATVTQKPFQIVYFPL